MKKTVAGKQSKRAAAILSSDGKYNIKKI